MQQNFLLFNVKIIFSCLPNSSVYGFIMNKFEFIKHTLGVANINYSLTLILLTRVYEAHFHY